MFFKYKYTVLRCFAVLSPQKGLTRNTLQGRAYCAMVRLFFGSGWMPCEGDGGGNGGGDCTDGGGVSACLQVGARVRLYLGVGWAAAW